jgi:hypothetical protein
MTSRRRLGRAPGTALRRTAAAPLLRIEGAGGQMGTLIDQVSPGRHLGQPGVETSTSAPKRRPPR